MITLKQLRDLENLGTWNHVLRGLNEQMKSFDRECQPMYMNRLNGLRAGKLKPREIELRALLAYTGSVCDSFKD